MSRREPDPVRITSATHGRSADIGHRERRYVITMGIRTACFLAAVGALMAGLPAWVCWLFIGGSLVLPYIAVVMANAGSHPDPGGPLPFAVDSEVRALHGPVSTENDPPGHRTSPQS